MLKTVIREIKNSLGRYLAMLAIIALGTGFFSGLVITRPAMINTIDRYIKDTSFYDWRLISTLGYTQKEVDEMAELDYISAAEGSVAVDVLVRRDNGSDAVYKAHSITSETNRLELNSGRMPESANECVADWLFYSEEDIGETIKLSEDNEQDTLDMFAYREYTIVGIATSPSYINFERGSTSLGNGTISSYFYIPYDGFDVDYYTDVYITLDETAGAYTDAYERLTSQSEDKMTEAADETALSRYDDIVSEAEEKLSDGQREYDEGYSEYNDGLKEYEEKKAEAQQELDDAHSQLESAESRIQKGWSDYYSGRDELEKRRAEAQQELDDALAQLNSGEADYLEGRRKLEDSEAEYQQGYAEYEDGKEQLASGRIQLEEAAAELEAGEQQLADGEMTLQSSQQQFDLAMLGITAAVNLHLGLNGQPGTVLTPSQVLKRIENGDDDVIEAVDSVLALSGEMDDAYELLDAKEQLDEGWKELRAGQKELEEGRLEYEDGLLQLEESEAMLEEAGQQLADARAQLDEGWAQIVDARAQLDEGWQQYNDGVEEFQNEIRKAEEQLDSAYATLKDSERKTAEGWKDYNEGSEKADREFADAEKELTDGKKELDDAQHKLDDARKEIDDLEKPDVYVLGRNTNIGYACFENDSKIVEGVARVFPVFFILVAALVCITTMTRMVDEQRTQIGTYKALGFTSGRIMAKYLLYSGSAAVIGCIIGFFLGTYIFPIMIWQGYSIMYGITDIDYYLDIPMGLAATAAYLGVSTFATWYACRRELREVPAELIRPKAPKAGKRLLIEKVTFIWKHVGFLYKVSIRNVMRYKQRMFMMVLGIGGCTALLITGFGVRDSIKDIVRIQYGEIFKFEYAITFKDGQTEESLQAISDELDGVVGDMTLAYQGTMDLELGNTVKSVNVVMPAEGGLENVVDLHNEDGPVAFPGAGEVIICKNLAKSYGLKVGDTICLRGSDMRALSLTVSGVFLNYTYNYVYVSPESFMEQWGSLPDMKTAFADPAQGVDTHEASARLLGMDEVAAITVSTDMEEMVDKMMMSLDYIVLMIIFCSGALAFIVLYNLTNINITERIREIATIKVLGFYPRESASYVFRENFMLTALGALVGIPLGIWLLRFVMTQIKIDMMYFEARILPVSYIWSIALTLLFACIVNGIMYFKLERINMAEALKSIE